MVIVTLSLELHLTKPPNIVVFQTDDHARWALSVYGGQRFTAPNIDALAKRGIVMENAFTPTPVCSPARASFFTGLVPSQHGVRDFISSMPGFHEQDRLKGIETLPQTLSQAGYTCGLAGKWHIGRDNTPAPGFKSWQAMSGAFPIHHQGKHEFSIDGQILQKSGVLTDVITDCALDILQQRGADAPFFLYVGYYATHSPWSGHPEHLVPQDEPSAELELSPAGFQVLNVELRNADANDQRLALAQYRAAIAEIDAGVGRILDALPDGEDTIIVYTSDHGLSLGQNGLFGKGNATYPQNLFDNHIRIPMILSRPGHWPEDTSSPVLADLTDLHATLGTAAGVFGTETDGKTRPGQDIVAAVNGETKGKSFQICEYGQKALLHDGRQSFEHPQFENESIMPKFQLMEAFYQNIDCIPPWEWTPENKYTFNPTDAWHPPTGPE